MCRRVMCSIFSSMAVGSSLLSVELETVAPGDWVESLSTAHLLAWEGVVSPGVHNDEKFDPLLKRSMSDDLDITGLKPPSC